MDDPNHKSRQSAQWIAATLIFACILAGIAFPIYLGSKVFETNDCLQPEPDSLITFPPDDIGGIDPQEGMTLYVPPSAQNFGSECVNFQGMVLHLWFDIDAEDMNLLVDRSSIADLLILPEDVEYAPRFGPTPRGAEQSGFFMARKLCKDEAPCAMTIWVEGTDPNVYRVYASFSYGD